MIRAIIPILLAGAPRIVGGEPSTPVQDATVFMRLEQSTCSGTLVASNLVLTARHCVAKVADASSIEVSIGIGARHVPAIAHGKRIFVPQSNEAGDDIALLSLDRRIVDVVPASVRTTPAAIGERGIAVGYGEDGDGEVPEVRKQRAGIRIDAIGPAVVEYESSIGESIRVDVADKMIATGESTCFGDSGGPLFDDDGFVIGVTSSGVDEQCRDRPSLFVGTHDFEALFTRARAETTPGQGLAESALGVDDPDSMRAPPPSSNGCSAGGARPATSDLAWPLLFGVMASARLRRRRVALFALLAMSCRSSTNIGRPILTHEHDEPTGEQNDDTMSSPLPPADPKGACGGEKSEIACRECCLEREPLAGDRYAQTFSACACSTPGTCATECGDSYCAGKPPRATCYECIAHADSCDHLAMQACVSDSACSPLLDCIAESECAALSR